MVATDISGDAMVQQRRVGEVQCDQGKIVAGDVLGKGARVASADNPGLVAGSSSGRKSSLSIKAFPAGLI